MSEINRDLSIAVGLFVLAVLGWALLVAYSIDQLKTLRADVLYTQDK